MSTPEQPVQPEQPSPPSGKEPSPPAPLPVRGRGETDAAVGGPRLDVAGGEQVRFRRGRRAPLPRTGRGVGVRVLLQTRASKTEPERVGYNNKQHHQLLKAAKHRPARHPANERALVATR